MSDSDPLYPGQQVFLKRPLQIYGTVIGRPVGDSQRPGDQVRYNVEIMPLEQIYLPEELELATEALPVLPRADYRIPPPAPEPPPAPPLQVFAPPPILPSASELESVSAPPPTASSSWAPANERSHFGEFVNLYTVDSFDEIAQEIHELIARRAHELYTYRGYAHGHDAEDWCHATSELLLSVSTDITETESQLNIYADLPGVSGKNLEVSVGRRAICISGTRLTPSAMGGKSISSERRSNRVFRILELPCEIHPDSVTASLNGGVLEVKLPKADMRNVIEFRSNSNAA